MLMLIAGPRSNFVSIYSKAWWRRMSEGGDGSLINIYAQLDSQEMPIPKDLSDYWQDPSSYFLIPGDLSTAYLFVGRSMITNRSQLLDGSIRCP